RAEPRWYLFVLSSYRSSRSSSTTSTYHYILLASRSSVRARCPNNRLCRLEIYFVCMDSGMHDRTIQHGAQGLAALCAHGQRGVPAPPTIGLNDWPVAPRVCRRRRNGYGGPRSQPQTRAAHAAAWRPRRAVGGYAQSLLGSHWPRSAPRHAALVASSAAA